MRLTIAGLAQRVKSERERESEDILNVVENG
jgi:hypothetical protein